MGWLRAIADVLGAVAWPVIVLIAVVMLRREIAEVMKRRITLTRGEMTVQVEAADAMRRVEEAAAALAAPPTPQEGEQRSIEEEAAERRRLVEQLLHAASNLGWAAGAAGDDRPPRAGLDWSAEGKALLRGNLTTDEGWQMAKARLAVRLEDLLQDPSLSDVERNKAANELIEMLERERQKQLDISKL